MRDLSSKYRQSALGAAWVIIMPLITVAMFVVMSRSGILNIKATGVPYPIYAIIGLSIWNLFSGGVMACSGALVGAGSMVAKINFPKVALVLAASGQGIVDFLIRMVLFVILFFYFDVVPSWEGLVLAFISLLPLCLLMLGFGFVMSLFTAIVRDSMNMLNLLLTSLMLLTPIVYPIGGENFLASANNFNPLNFLVNVPRDLIIKGETELFYGYIWSTLIAAIFFYVGWRFFYLGQVKIVERL